MPKLLLIFLLPSLFFSNRALSRTVSLDGEWNFAVDSAGVFTVSDVWSRASWRKAVVPLSWQAQFSDLRNHQGVAWYRRSFTLPSLAFGEVLLIHFGAVDYRADVYLNGELVGTHDGGYLPFDVEVTAQFKKGKNDLVVRVMDPVPGPVGTEGVLYSEIPHGKQSWYVQTSGPWQSVSLEIKPVRHFELVHVTPIINGRVSVDVRMTSTKSSLQGETIKFVLFSPEKKMVAEFIKPILSQDDSPHYEFNVASPSLWSPDSPKLYKLLTILSTGDTAVDEFGFRSFETRDGKFYLNGKPIFLIGALDQDFYPETVYTPPSENYIRDEMIKAKKLGLNLLRCHIKVPDPRYLKAADAVGMLVWYEIPNWDKLTPESEERGKKTLDGMLARDWNHPSLLAICLINESWGIDLRDSLQRIWLKNFYDYAKGKATGRLIVDNSPCCDNFHIKTDMADWHTYWAIPEARNQFRATVEEVSRRPEWLFSKYSDAEPTGREPLMISEFGNWGLPVIPKQRPWWFSRPFADARVVMPAGVEMRLAEYKYGSMFKNYDSLAVESERAQFDALKFEIETMRSNRNIAGYVVTEFTDINWESNGLMNMWRHPKVYANSLSNIQQQDILIPQVDKWNYWAGEDVTIRLSLSHYSSVNLKGARVIWHTSGNQRGELDVPEVSAGDVVEFPPVTVKTIDANAVACKRIYFDVVGADNKSICENHLDIFVYPRIEAAETVRLYGDSSFVSSLSNDSIEKSLRIVSAENADVPFLTNVIDDSMNAELRRGAAVICLTDSLTKFDERLPFSLGLRDTGWYDGNWASNMNWDRNEKEPFKGVNLYRRLGFQISDAIPKMFLAGIQGDHFEDVLAGLYIGWVHLSSAYVVQMRCGAGKLIVCTLPIGQNCLHDPYSRSLLTKLLRYVKSRECNPKYSIGR